MQHSLEIIPTSSAQIYTCVLINFTMKQISTEYREAKILYTSDKIFIWLWRRQHIVFYFLWSNVWSILFISQINSNTLLPFTAISKKNKHKIWMCMFICLLFFTLWMSNVYTSFTDFQSYVNALYIISGVYNTVMELYSMWSHSCGLSKEEEEGFALLYCSAYKHIFVYKSHGK